MTSCSHLPPVLNIVVLDTTNLRLTDQMYLAYEFNRFLKTLPPDLPLAIYARVGAAPVLVQDFTSDRQLLLAASAKVMPHLTPPGVGNHGDAAQPTFSSTLRPNSRRSLATRTSSGSPAAPPIETGIPLPILKLFEIPAKLISAKPTTSSRRLASLSIPSMPAV